jgi:hypothetical protein
MDLVLFSCKSLYKIEAPVSYFDTVLGGHAALSEKRMRGYLVFHTVIINYGKWNRMLRFSSFIVNQTHNILKTGDAKDSQS